MLKRIILITFSILALASLTFGATLNLMATWTANTEPDMASYKLYRTDGVRTLIGTIPHPAVTYDFSVTAPDNEDYMLTFVLTAIDTANNESLDGNVAPFVSNLKAPAAPGTLGVKEKQ